MNNPKQQDKKSLTKTGYMAYCIAMLKDVIKVSLWQKGQNDRHDNLCLSMICPYNDVENCF
jgi:hypothetical protein